MQKSLLFVICGMLLMSISSFAQKPSLRGSKASVQRMDRQATVHNYTRIQTPKQVDRFEDLGLLVELKGNRNYKVEGAKFPVVRPETKLFVERLSSQSRVKCRNGLAVTSATRPLSAQPRNASKKSVHPAGMAVDFRIPDSTSCRSWLETTLLTLEGRKVIEATKEKSPPHFHVAVFSKPYSDYVKAKINPSQKPKKKK